MGERGDDDEVELLTASQVAALVGWKSSGTPADLVKRGNFPRWVREYGRTKLWDRAEVEAWMRTAPRKGRRT